MIEYVAPVSVTSPCIGVCVIGEDGWCEGCGRSLDEIATWLAMTPARRHVVTAKSQERLAAMRG